MRVEFQPDPETEGKPGYGWGRLSPGSEYTVLEVYFRRKRPPLYRLMDSELEGPALFDSSSFTVTCTKMPSAWNIFQLEEGGFILRPPAWSELGYWEDYYDRAPGAVEIFEEEYRRVLRDS